MSITRQGARSGVSRRERGSGDTFATGMSFLLAMVVAQRGIGFARNLWFCRVMSPEELGRWNMAFSLIVLAAPLFVLGLPGSFGRYVEHYRRHGQLGTYLRRTLLVTGLLGALGVGLMLLGGTRTAWLTLGRAQDYGLLVTVALSLLVVVLFNALTEICTALRQVRWVAAIQFVNSLLFALLAWLLLSTTGGGSETIVFAYALACGVTGMLAFVALSRGGYWRASDHAPLSVYDQWSKIAPFALGIWCSNLLTNLFAAADRYMIMHSSSHTPEQAAYLVGQYHSSRVLGDLLVSVALLTSSVLLPYLSRDWERGNRRAVGWRLNLALKGTCLALFFVSACAIFVAPWLFEHALQKKYSAGLAVLPWTMAFCIWFGLSAVTQTYLLCAERSQRLSLAYLVGLAINIVLNYQWLPRYGLWGAILATAVANAVTLGILLLLCRAYGFRLAAGTLMMLMLPLALPAGAMFCFALCAALAGSPSLRQLVFSSRERAQCGVAWRAALSRLQVRRMASPGVATATTSTAAHPS